MLSSENSHSIVTTTVLWGEEKKKSRKSQDVRPTYRQQMHSTQTGEKNQMLTEKMDQGDPPKHLALRIYLRRKKKKQHSQYVNKSSKGEIIIDELFYFIFLKTTCQTTERKRKREKHGRHSGSGACHILICIKITCVGQSVTYLPFQSVTRMQYQQNKETKKKR